MGLLTEGSPLSWEETKALANHVRQHGVVQFINLYRRLRDRQGDVLKWGDEVEYILVKFDNENKVARVSLSASEILNVLQEKELKNPNGVKSLWRPEYGAYMVEGTPGKPYGGLLAHFNIVEANMKYRREEVARLLSPDEAVMSLTSFPRLGSPDFTDPRTVPTPQNGASCSLFFPDDAIYPGHPRFKTLTRNIRQRRGSKVAINLPIFKDKKTLSPFVEDLKALGDDGESTEAALPDHVYMDAMGFGMGCCCLQLTFQACNINEARTLYDQLTPLCPIMLALTAASPLHRGYVTDVDCRWNVISCSVDCRTREERGEIPLKHNKFRIPKSRYDSIDSYLSPQGEKYNDVPLIYDKAIYEQLRDADIDHLLAQHIAHLFIRDSVSLFSEKVHQDDEQDTDHFENIQSTNWQTMRFKPPPPNSPIGWRVEFRPCEVQITDFENAAIVCFVVLLTRVILSYQLNFLIPISKVDENMKRAQKRDALRQEVFYFRKDITTLVSPPAATSCCQATDCSDVYITMTVDQIINGKADEFPGLIPLINGYLSGMDVDADTHCTIQQYLKLIQRRASGDLQTTARWIRQFVSSHPEYRHDSVVSERINYDLLKQIHRIQTGETPCPELLGTSLESKTQESIPAAVQKAEAMNEHSMRRFFQAYNKFLKSHPGPVQSVQTGVLMVVGDVTCQMFVEKKTLKTLDIMRMLKFGGIGLFFVGPVLQRWYRLLDKTMKAPYIPLKKVACDQIIVAPVLLFIITSGVSLLDNKTIEETKEKLQKSYFDILLANYKIWPLLQAVNFSVVPLNYQLLLVQTVAIFWNAYLSYKTHQEII